MHGLRERRLHFRPAVDFCPCDHRYQNRRSRQREYLPRATGFGLLTFCCGASPSELRRLHCAREANVVHEHLADFVPAVSRYRRLRLLGLGWRCLRADAGPRRLEIGGDGREPKGQLVEKRADVRLKIPEHVDGPFIQMPCDRCDLRCKEPRQFGYVA